jgi:hypothetical protein
MNRPEDLTDAERREALELWERDREAALKRGDLDCKKCGNEADRFDGNDPRAPICKVCSGEGDDDGPLDYEGEGDGGSGEREQMARIQAWR